MESYSSSTLRKTATAEASKIQQREAKEGGEKDGDMSQGGNNAICSTPCSGGFQSAKGISDRVHLEGESDGIVYSWPEHTINKHGTPLRPGEQLTKTIRQI